MFERSSIEFYFFFILILIWFMDKAMISTTVVFVLKVLREQNAQFHKSKCDNMF